MLKIINYEIYPKFSGFFHPRRGNNEEEQVGRY